MTTDTPQPKLFISYSWTTPTHEQWVMELAVRLSEDDVDVIIDKWALREGHDAHAFMEQMVTDPSISKVIMICDVAYVEKANSRAKGVGTETQIITGEIYGNTTQDKFVAVIAEKDAQGHALFQRTTGAAFISTCQIPRALKRNTSGCFDGSMTSHFT